MTYTRPILKILGGAAACLGFAATAQADYGGIRLFDGANFGGEVREINLPAQRLTAIRFNDRAASVDVQGQGWLLCRDSDFEGPCIVVREPVQDLDQFGMGDNISSARPLSDRNPYPHGTVFGQNYYGEIEFYESDYFGNLSVMDPYDSWGYAYGDGYQTGQYGAYGRYGRYNPYNPTYDYNPNDWNGYRGPRNADIVLYRDPDFRGSAYGLNRDAWSLSDLYFNDEVSSIEVREGRWEVCTDSNFRGQCKIIDASQNSLGPVRLNDNISSIRRVGGNRGRTDQSTGGGRYDGQKARPPVIQNQARNTRPAAGGNYQGNRFSGASDDILRGGRNDRTIPGQPRTENRRPDTNVRNRASEQSRQQQTDVIRQRQQAAERQKQDRQRADQQRQNDQRRTGDRYSGPRNLRGDESRAKPRRSDMGVWNERQQGQKARQPVRENDVRANQNNRNKRPQVRQTPAPAQQQARPPQRETKQQRLIRNAQQPVAKTPPAQVQPARPSVTQSRRNERPANQYRGHKRDRAEVK